MTFPFPGDDAIRTGVPGRFSALFLAAIVVFAQPGCQEPDRHARGGRRPSREKVAPAWSLYQSLVEKGVKDADLDKGFFKTDYINKKRTAVRAGDGVIEKEEVLEYALENYEKYEAVIRERLGVEVPWILDDSNPDTSFDARLREKVRKAIRAIEETLASAGYRRGEDRYDELTAASLYAFALASAKGTQPAARIPAEIGTELGEARLDGVVSFIRENGGLGRADVKEDCRLESDALEAIQKKCGRCSEDSKILYALFRMAGLDAHFVYGRIDYKTLNDENLAPGFLHFSVALVTRRGTRIFDLANRHSDAERIYDQKLDWWFIGTNREILSLHYAGLCIRYVKVSKPDSAIAACEKSLQLDPRSYVALTNLGAAYAKRRFYSQALEFYRRALAIEPGSAEAHYDLGGVYYATGEERRAVESLDRALELYPDFANAHNALGAIYMERGEMEQAKRHFRRALRIRPDDALFNRNLDRAEKSQKR